MNISNLTGISSDNENKMVAFVRAVAELESLGSKAALKYEGPLHLESSVLKQTVLLITGESDPKDGFTWSRKERKSFLERYLDGSSRIANQEKVQLLLKFNFYLMMLALVLVLTCFLLRASRTRQTLRHNSVSLIVIFY